MWTKEEAFKISSIVLGSKEGPRGEVELQDVMGDDLAIVNAARVSFLGASKGEEADKKLLFYLMKNRHDSPFEMCEMKFRIKAPLMSWTQILRHRSGNFNLQSFRYLEVGDEEEFYIPEEWRLQDHKNRQASTSQNVDATTGKLLSDKLVDHVMASMELYQEALACGVAREQARVYLPAYALYSVGIVKFDVRNLMHFLSLRMDEHAQWETRQYANAMWKYFEACFPWTAEAYGEFKRR